MWLVFGIGAIIFAGLNVIWAFKNKNAKWFRFFSLSLTYARFMLMGQYVLLEKIGEDSWILCLP